MWLKISCAVLIQQPSCADTFTISLVIIVGCSNLVQMSGLRRGLLSCRQVLHLAARQSLVATNEAALALGTTSLSPSTSSIAQLQSTAAGCHQIAARGFASSRNFQDYYTPIRPPVRRCLIINDPQCYSAAALPHPYSRLLSALRSTAKCGLPDHSGENGVCD